MKQDRDSAVRGRPRPLVDVFDGVALLLLRLGILLSRLLLTLLLLLLLLQQLLLLLLLSFA